MNTVSVSGANIVNIMEPVTGNCIIGVCTRTVEPLTGGKGNDQQTRVEKHVEKSNVMVFTNQKQNGYDNMVKRRLTKEGKNPESFKIGERRWGTRIPNTPFVEHKGKLYMEVIFLRAGETSYTLDGAPIAKEDIQGLKSSSNGEQGGLNDKVIIRTYKISSLVSITINGIKYTDIQE